MYQGYRINVNGKIIDNFMIVRGTYYAIPVSRVLDSYYDAAGGFHEEIHPVKKMEIGFTIREHSMEEHLAIMSAFSDRNVSVEYWNDRTGDYDMGVFRVEDLKSTHKHAAGGIRYGEIEVVLKEN
jgi:hypothetical protein